MKTQGFLLQYPDGGSEIGGNTSAFVVPVMSDLLGNFTTTVDSRQVIQAINENKVVLYKFNFIDSKKESATATTTSIFFEEDNSPAILIFVRGSSTLILTFIHEGTTIQQLDAATSELNDPEPEVPGR